MTFEEREDILNDLYNSIKSKSNEIRKLKSEINHLVGSKSQDQLLIKILKHQYPDITNKYCKNYYYVDKTLMVELKNYKRLEFYNTTTTDTQGIPERKLSRSFRVDNKGNYYLPVIDKDDNKVYLSTSDFINFYEVDKAKGKKVIEFCWYDDYTIIINNFIITSTSKNGYISVYKII